MGANNIIQQGTIKRILKNLGISLNELESGQYQINPLSIEPDFSDLEEDEEVTPEWQKQPWYQKRQETQLAFCEKKYKTAGGYGYHGTSPSQARGIKSRGLNSGTFFASNEGDCSPYTDGALLRFPFPQKYQKRVGRGDYYTTLETIPASSIQIKMGPWGNWKKL